MRRDNLTVIVLALAALSAAAALAAQAAHSPQPTRLPAQSVMPISELTNAAAKDLPVQPFGRFTSP